jgi:hypothetical protein
MAPGKIVELPPDFPANGAESVARGAVAYRGACASCHGDKGKGDGAQDQRDDSGVPIRPRDFTLGIFKGGREPRQLYTRILLGLPGTPMPASPTYKPGEIGDLVNFILSLSSPEAQAKVEHRRRQVVAKRTDGPLPEEMSAAAWQAAEPAPIVVSPLWWRAYVPPELEVRALHDGQSLAVRLTWLDETRNDSAVRPQDFEDMAAVQLFKGSPEPFLGMGAANGALDVWLWQADASLRADVDTAHPNMAVDLYPFEKPGNGSRPHARDLQPPEFLTAQAAGNLRSDPARPPATNLQAKGPGTLTMRPKVSQVVRATGQWQDGRWTVVLRRPLVVAADAGIRLAPGDRLSVAFAIWDGAARDRNGQKLISIWHDLKLE